MSITSTNGKPTLSFEFFPPKNPEGEERFWQALADLSRFGPDFISVTYGAGGGDRENTPRLVVEAQEKFKLTAMAHLTCIGDSEENLSALLDGYREKGITHILALRGDRQPEMEASGAFDNARDFVAFIQERHPGFSVGVAAYPETHPDAENRAADLAFFKQKVAAGAGFAVTQFFYENAAYFRLLEECEAMGIDIPVIPGVLPVTDYKQIKRFTELCGAALPDWLVSRLEAVQDDPAKMMDVGVEVAIEQCRELLDQGAPGLHFFTLNKAEAVSRVLEALEL